MDDFFLGTTLAGIVIVACFALGILWASRY
jgi:hypothetical protein